MDEKFTIKKAFITNAFSLNMLKNPVVEMKIEESNWEEIAKLFELLNKQDGIKYNGTFMEIYNCFGHKATANIIKNIYNINIKNNRTTVEVDSGDTIFVIQYLGERLEEGAKTLPEGAVLKPLKITIK